MYEQNSGGSRAFIIYSMAKGDIGVDREDVPRFTTGYKGVRLSSMIRISRLKTTDGVCGGFLKRSS